MSVPLLVSGLDLLVDHQIRAALSDGRIVCTPDAGIDTRIQPASLDIRLGERFAVLAAHRLGVIDPKVDSRHAWDLIEASDEFVVPPGHLVLAASLEQVQLADTILARVEGKSSLGRLGVQVHATAGYIDPGWPLAAITLEISTVAQIPVKLYPGMPVAQLAFDQVDAVAVPYCGKYSHQPGPQLSLYHQNWLGTRWS